MRKDLTYPNGKHYIEIDCGDYIIEISSSEDGDYSNSVKYLSKDKSKLTLTSFIFNIKIDDEKDGGKIKISTSNKWGCEISFTHFLPHSYKDVFDKIAKCFDMDLTVLK